MTGIDSREDESLKQRLISLTRDLMLMPGSASRPEERERCYEFIKNHFDTLRTVESREYRDNGIPSLVALPSGFETPDVLLCGHLDVVDHATTDSYHSRLENDRIHGPGAGDMKGPLAIMLELFHHMHTRYEGASLGIAITADEETGGMHGTGYLFGREGLRCGLAMIPDGGSLNRITVEEKGILHLELRCGGNPGHAARPWLGVNPVESLVARLDNLRKAFSSRWPADGGEHWHPTCATTRIGTPNQTINAIPSEAHATLDIRFPAPYTVEQLRSFVEETLGPDVDVSTLISAEPVHLAPEETYRRITEEITGKPAEFVRGHGGSDARFICHLGIPVIMSRPLMGNLHAPDEWIDATSMVSFYRIYERYLHCKLGLDQ